MAASDDQPEETIVQGPFRPFDKNYFLKLNAGTFIVDALVLSFVFFISKRIFGDQEILQTIPPRLNLGLYFIIVLTLPWHLGYLCSKFNAYYGETVKIIVIIIFSIVVFFTLLNIFPLFEKIELTDGKKGNAWTELMGKFSMLLLFVGPAIGYAGLKSGMEDFAPTIPKDTIGIVKPGFKFELKAYFVISVAFFIGLGMFFLDKFSFAENNLSKIIVILISLVLGFFVMLFLLIIKIKIAQLKKYKPFVLFAKTFFPALIVLAMMFWNQNNLAMYNEILNANHLRYSGTPYFIMLLITGYIPYRIILLFTPPLNLINISLGIITLAIYIHSFFA
jgi:hypothetical protein